MEQDEIDRYGKMIHDAAKSARPSSTATTGETPRTDAAAQELGEEHRKDGVVDADFARQLERELAEANRQLADVLATNTVQIADMQTQLVAARSATLTPTPEMIEELDGLSKFLADSVNMADMGHDHPPEPATQWDYELSQAAGRLYSIVEQLRARQAQPTETRRTEIPPELYDGMEVFVEANKAAGPDNTLKSHHVSAVLDAAVRLIRKRQRAEEGESK